MNTMAVLKLFSKPTPESDTEIRRVVTFLMKKNKVQVIWGEGAIDAPGKVTVKPGRGEAPKGALLPGQYQAKHIIIATGGGQAIGQQNPNQNVQRGTIENLMWGTGPFVCLRLKVASGAVGSAAGAAAGAAVCCPPSAPSASSFRMCRLSRKMSAWCASWVLQRMPLWVVSW